MPTSKIKGLDEQTLEGGVGSGAGGRSGVTSSNSKLDNVFGIEGKALSKPKQEKADKADTEQKSSRSYKPTENTVLGKRELSYSELSDAQRAALTPRQRKQLGADLEPFKTGGMASSRADGIAQRGKTKGRMC